MSSLPVIQIGPTTDDPAESVSAVNKAFIAGLADRYAFETINFNRRLGNTRQSSLNVANAFHFFRHIGLWSAGLLRRRPAVAHYAINSGWAFEKSLTFLGVARLFGARTIGHLHSGSFLTFWKSLSPIRKRRALRELSKLDALVVLSEGWRERVTANVGVGLEKLFVVNNPIDPGFEDAALKMPLDRATDSILSLGVIGRQKGVLDLLDAAERLKSNGVHVRLQLAGPEREPGTLAEMQRKMRNGSLSDSVTLSGSVAGDAKLKLFRQTSIFVLPSYFENFPLVTLEAAAAGHAIITTPVGATPEFFADGESAIFVEPGNIRQIADAIGLVITNRDLRMRLATAARQTFVEKLARHEIMAALDRVYRHVLQR